MIDFNQGVNVDVKTVFPGIEVKLNAGTICGRVEIDPGIVGPGLSFHFEGKVRLPPGLNIRIGPRHRLHRLTVSDEYSRFFGSPHQKRRDSSSADFLN